MSVKIYDDKRVITCSSITGGEELHRRIMAMLSLLQSVDDETLIAGDVREMAYMLADLMPSDDDFIGLYR